jgi:hypothetical protein
MALISVSEELATKSFTSIENKFITKYMPVLEPNAVKVYLYALYIYQNGLASYTIDDMAQALSMTVDEVVGYFEYLEESELVSVISSSPLEVKLMDADNIYGKPKKFKPEKYADFSKNIQNIIKGRMISTNEYREYFLLMEDYGFEQNALIMIITYCVNLRGDAIRPQYIKKVAKSFADDGITTAVKVDEKLSAYTASTPALIRIFSAVGINKQPDIDDDKLYKKWTLEFGFEDDAISTTAKLFKAKTSEKIDEALTELYKNKKFDVKEIEDYCKNKHSVYTATVEIARALGVYMQNTAPYIENYVNIWYNFGFSFDGMKMLANYSFKQGKCSFDDLDGIIKKLYDDGIVADSSIQEYLDNMYLEDNFLKKVLETCSLTRKVIAWDRESLKRWRSWNFSDDMLIEAAKLSAGKSNPMAYMNGILSSWKSEGIFTPERLAYSSSATKTEKPNDRKIDRAQIERHFNDLRHSAEDRAENNLKRATEDGVYRGIHNKLKELSIDLAFAEIRDTARAGEISAQIEKLEKDREKRLSELGMSKSDLVPQYSCKICNDTGYDKYGNPCTCMKDYIAKFK